MGAQRNNGRQWLGYGVTAGAVFLAWQIVQGPLVARAPVNLAVRIAPTSAAALQRAAEDEFAAGRLNNAKVLAEQSLAHAPFNVRALRVRGLVADREGDSKLADEILTLAGNWSLRDDPTHGWLVERRLSTGDFNSAFAHADTLVRRRADVQNQVFDLFTTAAKTDARALPALTRILKSKPPWAASYFDALAGEAANIPVLLTLVTALEPTPGRLDDDQLAKLYRVWLSDQRLFAISHLRSQTRRPDPRQRMVDGSFSREGPGLPPFDWTYGSNAGLTVEAVEADESTTDRALRVSYDGFGSTIIAYQMLTLEPGHYRLSGRQHLEEGRADAVGWIVACAETEKVLGQPSQKPEVSAWTSFSFGFTVPSTGCQIQWLRLKPSPQENHEDNVLWFDDLTIQPAPLSSPGIAD